jgi:hypothetical protein
MSEQETEQKTKEQEKEEPEEYTEEIKEIEKDHNEVEKVQDKFIYSAGSRVPKLANILKEYENPDGTKLDDEDIRNKLVHDLKGYWTKDTILDALPDWLKRDIEKPETEEAEGEGVPEEGKEAVEEDPVKAMKAELSQLKKQVSSQQKLIDKDQTKIGKLETELLAYQEQSKELKENSKLLDQILDIYDKKVGTLTFVVSGMSIKKIEEFAEKEHALSDDVSLIVKMTNKGYVIDSLT